MSNTDQTVFGDQASAKRVSRVHRSETLWFIAFLNSDVFRQKFFIFFTSAIFIIVVLSFRPFDAGDGPRTTAGGDAVNQIGFLSLLILCGLVVLTQIKARVLRIMASHIWLPVFAVIGLSVLMATDSASAMRALALALISAFVALSVIILPTNLRDFRMVLMISSIVIIAVSYVGIVIFPDAAIHAAGGSEAQHEGLWRGPFQHKNIAGPVFSVLAIIGIYLSRSGHSFFGICIALLSFFFVLKTGSKTTSGFLPLAILVVFSARALASPRAAITLILLTVISAGLLTVGTIYSDALKNITSSALADVTFTGRDNLWRFGIDNVMTKPLVGFGFDSFWQTDTVKNAALPTYAKWDFRGIVHGHNSYIDTFVTFGAIGAPIILFTVYIWPMFNYMRAYKDPWKRRTADMFMMIVTFTMLLSFMESFILSRADPIWILHIFAVFGLHFIANMKPPHSEEYIS